MASVLSKVSKVCVGQLPYHLSLAEESLDLVNMTSASSAVTVVFWVVVRGRGWDILARAEGARVGFLLGATQF